MKSCYTKYEGENTIIKNYIVFTKTSAKLVLCLIRVSCRVHKMAVPAAVDLLLIAHIVC